MTGSKRGVRVDRRGVLLAEAVVCVAVIAVAVSVLVPAVRTAAVARRVAEDRSLALEELHSVLERTRSEAAAGRFDADSLRRVTVREAVAARLPGAAFEVETADDAGRLRVDLTLTFGDGLRERLSAWVPEASP